MLEPRVRWFASVVFLLACYVAPADAAPADCEAARCAIEAAIDAECPCGEAENHGRYVSCVARVVNGAAREGTIPKRCRGEINGCFIRSLCGKRAGVALCDLPGDGVSGRCRPLPAEDECTRRGGAVVSRCCAPCTAATATPEPTAPEPTPTPVGPGATATSTTAATPPPATATPAASGTLDVTPTSAGTPTAGATVTPDGIPTATASGPATPTAVPGTPTPGATTTAAAPGTATPLGTATGSGPTATLAAATATPLVVSPTPAATATLVVAATPTTPATPTAQPTFVFDELFVDIEAEPDQGPPPLRVQFTSEVDDGTPPFTYDWDFGDGKPHGRVANPAHVYATEGEFTAVLRVTDARGIMGEEEYDILVERETLVRRKALPSRRTGFGERR